MLKFFYENINIYYSLYIYSDNTNIQQLCIDLKQNDYPYIILKKFDELCIKELSNRLFLIHINIFEKYLDAKSNHIDEITVIFIESDAYDKTCEYLKNKKTSTNSMYLVELDGITNI